MINFIYLLMVEKNEIRNLYVELQSSLKDDEKVLLLSGKILNLSSEEIEASQCKIMALINLHKFQDCENFIYTSKLEKTFVKELCYCLIELKKYEECENVINKYNIPEGNIIKAQLFYKSANYKKSFEFLKEKISKEIKKMDH